MNLSARLCTFPWKRSPSFGKCKGGRLNFELYFQVFCCFPADKELMADSYCTKVTDKQLNVRINILQKDIFPFSTANLCLMKKS